ncbi:hypothetical protein [Amycolatopsis cihanbeyliensis]|uniref:Uncharacterized protein n=1 Tax=Amycolatopsis cihanbeyliensis TaxID=1128664 RepID=A0A542DNL1_AMYCI|nr:hypothetical protein [Amycolatopsis cihanbeyliensis]TQJ04676.1 hypothetical protein FB471_4481 [Amycolatopsis cihanbeyliensis]
MGVRLGLADDVVVFIVSRGTNHDYRRVLWRVSRADAIKICSDPRTASQNYMLCWTDRNIDDEKLNRYVPDNGKHDAVLRDHGVTILKKA